MDDITQLLQRTADIREKAKAVDPANWKTDIEPDMAYAILDALGKDAINNLSRIGWFGTILRNLEPIAKLSDQYKLPHVSQIHPLRNTLDGTPTDDVTLDDVYDALGAHSLQMIKEKARGEAPDAQRGLQRRLVELVGYGKQAVLSNPRYRDDPMTMLNLDQFLVAINDQLQPRTIIGPDPDTHEGNIGKPLPKPDMPPL